MGLHLDALVTADKKAKVITPKPTSATSETYQVLAAIAKQKGDMVVVPGNMVPLVRRLPTRIFEFDYYTGGGFPRGRYSIIYGPESSCKTNVTWKAISSAQQNDPATCNQCAYVNLEQTYEPSWPTRLGVDTEKLLVVNPGYGEEAVDCIDALVRADDMDLIVVDSLAALVPNKEIAQSVEKYDMATAALLIKRLVNKLMYAFCEEARRGHFPTVILINQTRFKPGVMFGDPETMPGGEAQKFLSSLRIRTYGKNVVDKAANQNFFKDCHMVVKKAKVPVRAVDFNLQMCLMEHDGLKCGDTDSFNMVKGLLQSQGLLVKGPKGYTIAGVTQPCGYCLGKEPKMANCGGCDGSGEVFTTFSTLTAIADIYRSQAAFAAQLQDIVVGSSTNLMLVEEAPEAPANVAPGEVAMIQSPEVN
jgi:recombination protein RecA